MDNIIATNNPNLRLSELSVGLFSTLRVSLPMIPADAENVEIIVTKDALASAYPASYDSTLEEWQADIAAGQFDTLGKQKYEIAYLLGEEQFWDGQGWISVKAATISGITPQPTPSPFRYAVTSITAGDTTYHPDANGNIVLNSLGDVRHSDFAGLEDTAPGDTTAMVKVKFNALLAVLKGVAPVVAMAFSLIACGDALALTSATVFDDISGTNTIGEVVKAGGLTASDVHARPSDWMPTAADVGAVAVQANGGVAIGEATYAYGVYSHAEGRNTTASGYASHAEGLRTTASGYYSHAEGLRTTASGNASHAEGVSAKANETYSFAWNGDESITYNSHGIGTFNLNPLGGLSGLWIGESNLETILGGYAKKADIGSRGVTNITDGVTSGTYDEETRTANIRPLLGYTNYALSGTNQTLALDRSVQYLSISGTNALKVLAPTRVYDKARDFLVYVNTAGTNALDLTELTGIYATDASATNAVTKGMTMLMFTELTTNTWVIGRQTLNALK